MAKQIVAWCDVHLNRDGAQVPASSVQITLDHGLPMELDLCEPCHKEVVEPLALLLAEHGQPVKAATTAGKATRKASANTSPAGWPLMDCPVPGCDKQYAQRRGLEKHLAKVHPGEPDPTLPLGNDEEGYTCPECGRTFNRVQGLGRHRLHAHDVKGTSR